VKLQSFTNATPPYTGVPTDVYYPGMIGAETVDDNNWYLCTAPNTWRIIPVTSSGW
jgi:hypothetical protein